MITIDTILKEYFQYRDDGGVFFDLKKEKDLCNFESFLRENGYSKYLKNKLDEADNITSELEPPIVPVTPSTESYGEYVKQRYNNFFNKNPSQSTFDYLLQKVKEFRELPQTMQSAISFLERPENSELVNSSEFIANEIGQGEFALYLLLSISTKIDAKKEKGDIKFNGINYEIKRITARSSAIRFGSVMDLQSIKNFNYTLYGMQNLLSDKEYKGGEKIKELKSVLDKIISYRPRSIDPQAGSINSWVPEKMQKFYEFLKTLKAYLTKEQDYNRISADYKTGKNFVFKANDIGDNVYFKIPFDDLKKAASSGKQITTLEKTTDEQDTEELVSFSEDMSKLIDSFLKIYPDWESFKNKSTIEIKNVYSGNIKLLILISSPGKSTKFELDPNYEFNSINMTNRPQIKLI